MVPLPEERQSVLKAQIEHESLMMSVEAMSLTLINVNSHLRMLADHCGIDLKDATLTEPEKKATAVMSASVARRFLKLGVLAAAAKGRSDAPTSGNVGEIMGSLMQAAQEQYGQPLPEARTLDAVENLHPGFDVVATDMPMGISAEMDAALADAVLDAEPADPMQIVEFHDDHPDAGEINNIFADLEFEEAPQPTITHELRAVLPPVAFKHTPSKPPSPFRVRVFANFPGVNFRDDGSRQMGLANVIHTYGEDVDELVKENWISAAMAARLKMEFSMVPDAEVTSDVKLPAAGEIADAVATVAAQQVQAVEGSEVWIELPVDDEAQAAEAIISAYYVSMARFQSAVGAAYLQDRLKAIGMSG